MDELDAYGLVWRILKDNLTLNWAFFRWRTSPSYRVWMLFELQQLERKRQAKDAPPPDQWQRLLSGPLTKKKQAEYGGTTHRAVLLLDRHLYRENLSEYDRMIHQANAMMAATQRLTKL